MVLKIDPRANAVVRRLSGLAPLREDDMGHLYRIANRPMTKLVRGEIVRSSPGAMHDFIMMGWAAIVRQLHGGRRQILHVLLPGDALGPLSRFGDSVICLGDVVVARSPGLALSGPGRDGGGLARAIGKADEESIHFLAEHALRLGRMEAAERVANFACEMLYRLEKVGMVVGDAFSMPPIQQDIGDLLGLSTVHVNRTYKMLRETGVMGVTRTTMTIRNRPRLMDLGQFRPPLVDAPPAFSVDGAPPPSSSWGHGSSPPGPR
jgi:CRP-like cAMP-binding protein